MFQVEITKDGAPVTSRVEVEVALAVNRLTFGDIEAVDAEHGIWLIDLFNIDAMIPMQDILEDGASYLGKDDEGNWTKIEVPPMR